LGFRVSVKKNYKKNYKKSSGILKDPRWSKRIVGSN